MADSKIASHKRPAGGKSDPMKFFRNGYFSPGELARVRQLVRPSGTSMILPYDQFIEHDNRHREAESDAANPDYICQLAEEGGYNAIAVHYGVAKRYWTKLAGSVPLLLKISGKTSIPAADKPLSVHTSYVEDAVRLGACAIGYTMYYGSPRQDEDLPQLARIRKECDKYGMPLVIWAYPRGEAIDAKGGRDTNYAVESATRMAVEMGATIIKSNLPKPADHDFGELPGVPSYYKGVEEELKALDPKAQKWERAKRVVEAAQGIPVLFSGGSKIGDDDLLENAQACVDAGAFGFIFGRNMWKRKNKDAHMLTGKLQEMLDAKNF